MRRFGRWLGRVIRAIGAALPALLADAAFLAGAGLIAWGAWSIYPPAGFITGGALLMAMGWLTGRSIPASPPPE